MVARSLYNIVKWLYIYIHQKAGKVFVHNHTEHQSPNENDRRVSRGFQINPFIFKFSVFKGLSFDLSFSNWLQMAFYTWYSPLRTYCIVPKRNWLSPHCVLLGHITSSSLCFISSLDCYFFLYMHETFLLKSEAQMNFYYCQALWAMMLEKGAIWYIFWLLSFIIIIWSSSSIG